MELQIERSKFADALSTVARFAAAKSQLAAAQAILLEADEGRLILSATDVVTAGATTSIPASVTRPGRLAIPSRHLDEFVSQLPDATVSLTYDRETGRLTVRCGNSRANLASPVDPDDFPLLPAANTDASLVIDAKALANCLHRVLPATAAGDDRPALTSVCFGLGPQGLTLAAADGFRMAQARLAGAGAAQPVQMLIPARAAGELARLLSGGGMARLAPAGEGRSIALIVGATTIYARLVEAKFPDVSAVLPTGWRTRVTVSAADLKGALRRMAPFVDDAGVRLAILDARDGRLRVRSRDSEVGRATEDVPARVAGEPGRIAFNIPLLTGMLNTSRASEFTIFIQAPDKVLVIYEGAVAEHGAPDFWLAMPMHLPNADAADEEEPVAEAA